MVSNADNIYQQGWNDCLEWVIDDLNKFISENKIKGDKKNE